MTQYNTLSIKFFNLQLNKLKSGIKNGTEVTLNLSSNVTGDCNNKTNFPNKLSLTGTQVLRICKVFANNSSANIKLSKAQLSNIVQLGQLPDPLKLALRPISGILRLTGKILLKISFVKLC